MMLFVGVVNIKYIACSSHLINIENEVEVNFEKLENNKRVKKSISIF